MRNIFSKYYIFLLLFVASFATMAASSLDNAMIELEHSYQERIEKSLKQFLGTDYPFTVLVNLIPSNIEDPKQQALQKLQEESADYIDEMGYLPQPMLNELVSYKKEAVSLEKVEVTVLHYVELDKSKEGDLQKIVRSFFKQVPVSVDFQFYAQVAKSVKDARDTASEPDAEQGFLDKYFGGDLSKLLGSVGIFLAALLGFIGIVLFARFLSNSISTLAQNIGGALNLMASTMNDEKELKNRSEMLSSGEVKLIQDNLQKNISLLIHSIDHNTRHFTASLKEKKEDLIGLKRLIPLLMQEDSTVVSKAFKPDLIEQIEGISPEDYSKFGMKDFDRWLAQLVENVSLLQLKTGSSLGQMIKPEIANELFGQPGQKLIDIVNGNPSGTAVKILLDVLPPDKSQDFLETMDESYWNLILEDKIYDSVKVNEIASAMLESCKGASDGDENTEHKKALEEIILAPVTKLIEGKNVGEDEEFITRLGSISGEFAQMLRENIWTHRDLDRVPEEYLSRKINAMAPQDKLMFMFGMPQEKRDRFIEMLPEGKGKIILTDNLNRLLEREDADQEKAHAGELCKRFILELKLEAQDGKFKLSDAQNTSASDAPTDTPDVGDAGGLGNDSDDDFDMAA